MNYIVSNHPLENPRAQGQVVACDDFITMANNESEGLVLENLYVNVDSIDAETFSLLQAAMDGIVYFTDNQTHPDFVNVPIQDWGPTPPQQAGPQGGLNMDMGMGQPAAQDPYMGQQPMQPTQDEYLSAGGAEMTMDPNMSIVNNVLAESVSNETPMAANGSSEPAKVFLFGSSKGGTGKTFTSLLSARRYAQTHPNERIAFLDFDIVDGQVGISIHKFTPTMDKFYKEYVKGHAADFLTMREFKVNSENFPPNMDFYLAPKDYYIQDDQFWLTVLANAVANYDTVIFDSGIDYLHYAPISYAYSIADKIFLVSTTSIKSVNSVLKQIKKLKGEIQNDAFTADQGIGDRINIIITQCSAKDKNLNDTICKNLRAEAPIVARFGQMNEDINKAEFFQMWSIFDEKQAICQAIDNYMKL